MREVVEITGVVGGLILLVAVVGILSAAFGAGVGYSITTVYNIVMGASVDPHIGAVVGAIVGVSTIEISDD